MKHIHAGGLVLDADRIELALPEPNAGGPGVSGVRFFLMGGPFGKFDMAGVTIAQVAQTLSTKGVTGLVLLTSLGGNLGEGHQVASLIMRPERFAGVRPEGDGSRLFFDCGVKVTLPGKTVVQARDALIAAGVTIV